MIRYIMVILVIILVVGCGAPKPTTHNREQRVTEDNQRNLIKQQPQPDMSESVERQNLIRRLELSNDKNKVGWVYLMTNRSVIVGAYPVKGKISFLGSMLSNPEQMLDDPNGYDRSTGSKVVSAPQEDGSYGENGEGIFFFTVDGFYMEWNGKYMYSDHPFTLSQPPVLVYNVTPSDAQPEAAPDTPTTETVPTTQP